MLFVCCLCNSSNIMSTFVVFSERKVVHMEVVLPWEQMVYSNFIHIGE